MGNYEEFKRRIDRLINIDLNSYKEAQMKRRIESLIKRNGYSDFSSYYGAISRDEDLLEEFVNYLTINVSEFYRNKSQWAVLEEYIIPELMKNNRGMLRVWSAACSTGEEPYSLVMNMTKHYPLNRIRIYATDIDEGALLKAKEGIYLKKSLENLPSNLIRKYFKELDCGRLEISREVKDRVDFQKSDLLKDDFNKNYDMIVCRNVMIYFTEEAKVRLYTKFNESLIKGGILFVGSTEQIINPDRFGFKSFKTFFYQKIREIN